MLRRALATHVGDVIADPDRLRMLRRTGLMGSAHEEHLERWATVAAEALGTSVALVAMIGDDRQVVAGCSGRAGWTRDHGVARLTNAFCRCVVAEGVPLATQDARHHAARRATVDVGAVAYAGAPIVISGQAIGVLCVLEPEAREWIDADLRLLERLAEGLAAEIQLRIVAADLTRSVALSECHVRVHELIAGDRPLPEILQAIVTSIETHDPELLGSLLLLDPERRTLHHGAAARLPAAYQTAMDGLAIGPTVGTCGRAAWLGEEVMTEDIEEDPRWDAHRHLTDPLGLHHCWSFPIIRTDGVVLGTFGVYGRRARMPSEGDRRFLRDAAQLAGIAIERCQARERLVFATTHDALTGLLSRAAAFARLDELLARDPATRTTVSVLSVDLDRLKVINDSLGHDTGDHVIAQAARRLRECAGPDALVARLGGEEFLVVSEAAAGDAIVLARSALRALRVPVPGLHSGQAITVTASIGIATVAGEGVDAHQATRLADTAMNVAKGRGGDRYATCDHADAATSTRRLMIESALRGAIARDELTVVYQPLQRFADRHTGAVEALVRWQHPELGQVGPDEFIPIAEASGLIGEIGAWVLRTACADVPALDAAYGHAMQVGINVSAQQLRDPGLASSIAKALRTHGLAPDRLYIEITETALLASDDTTLQTVRALDALGAHIALDDFGTGYSSLAVLKRFPIKAIKIDRSFVAGLIDDHDDRVIVTAMIGMARSLGLGTVAEGVETTAQHELLAELGCDFAQGYLIGRPAPVPLRSADGGRAVRHSDGSLE